jgi:hypothetical protein
MKSGDKISTIKNTKIEPLVSLKLTSSTKTEFYQKSTIKNLGKNFKKPYNFPI